MPYYRKTVVDCVRPDEKFICKKCNCSYTSNPEEKYHKVRLKMIDGTEEQYCVKCASTITRKPKSSFSKKARWLYSIK